MTQLRATRARFRDKTDACPSNSLFISWDLCGYLGYSRFDLLGHSTGAQFPSTVLIPYSKYRNMFLALTNIDFESSTFRYWFRRIVSLWIQMLVTVLSVPINRAHWDRSVEGAGVRDVPQNFRQDIFQNICLPDIRSDPVLNLIFSHSVAVILFRTHRHPFAIYKLFELLLVML